MSKKIYSKIGELRRSKKLTQANLAELINVTPTTVANWENGRSLLYHIETVCKLCKIFRCEPGNLIGYIYTNRTDDEDDIRIEEIRQRLLEFENDLTDKID